MDEQVEIVQPEDWLNADATANLTPVFLIHDGGGTIFSYHCLGPLGRQVYGIPNPRFQIGGYFQGGIPEMVNLYCSHIRKTIAGPEFPPKAKNPDGCANILLGGWSMGGMLSLGIARALSDDAKINIIGILMVDSMCPLRPATPTTTAPWDNSTEGKNKNQLLAQNCMTSARKMIQNFSLPEWEGRQVPKVALLRARECVPVTEDGVHGVDIYREDKHLGWDSYQQGMVVKAMDVDGHHFNVFDTERLGGIAAAMKHALDMLDSEKES